MTYTTYTTHEPHATRESPGNQGDPAAQRARKLVLCDFRGEAMTSVFDADAGIALDSTFVKVVAWYDNEYGYTCNMLRLVKHVAK